VRDHLLDCLHSPAIRRNLRHNLAATPSKVYEIPWYLEFILSGHRDPRQLAALSRGKRGSQGEGTVLREVEQLVVEVEQPVVEVERHVVEVKRYVVEVKRKEISAARSRGRNLGLNSIRARPVESGALYFSNG